MQSNTIKKKIKKTKSSYLRKNYISYGKLKVTYITIHLRTQRAEIWLKLDHAFNPLTSIIYFKPLNLKKKVTDILRDIIFYYSD